nr:hypothetical protein [uncultured Treponema sp.]
MDFLCGAGTLALGHNDDEVNQAMIEMITKDAPIHTLDLTTPVKDNFVHTLLSLLPPELGNNAKFSSVHLAERMQLMQPSSFVKQLQAAQA